MSLHPVHFEWGGRKWPKHRRSRVAAVCLDAVEVVDWFNDQMGLDLPKVEALKVNSRSSSSSFLSGGIVEGELHLDIPTKVIKRSYSFTSYLGQASLVIAHELMHKRRSDAGFPESFMEISVDEGLAHVAEYALAVRLNDGMANAVINPADFAICSEQDKEFYHSLIDEVVLPSVGNGPECEAKFTPGELIGIGAVSTVVAAGYKLRDVVDMPAERVVDLALGVDTDRYPQEPAGVQHEA